MATLCLKLQYEALLQPFPSDCPVDINYYYDEEVNREYEIGQLHTEVRAWCHENLLGVPLVKILPLRARYELNDDGSITAEKDNNYYFELVFENEVDLIFFKMRWSV